MDIEVVIDNKILELHVVGRVGIHAGLKEDWVIIAEPP